jgi:hypothetical protein
MLLMGGYGWLWDEGCTEDANNKGHYIPIAKK